MDKKNLPREAREDPFGPPAVPVDVECLHCGERYSSGEMESRRWADGIRRWSCPTPGCDGAGFGFDIHRVEEGGEGV